MVNKERLIGRFKKLVSFDAESFHEREICDYLKCTLEELGLSVEEDDAGARLNSSSQDKGTAGNLYAKLSGDGGKGETLLFSAHMDTVSPGIGKKAIIHENGVITSDERTVLGADDAAGLAEILEMLAVIKEEGLLHPDIEILFTVAEEPYSAGCELFDFSKIKAKIGYVLDMSGTVGGAALAAPAILSFKAEIIGRAAHAGFSPEQGIHSIAIAAKALSKIQNGFVEKDTTVNVGMISGGTGRNIVPESVSLSGEIRSMDNEKALYYMRQLEDTLRQEAEKADGRLVFSYHQHFQAYRISKEEEVARRYQKACESQGITPYFKETFGGSDNNRFPEHGIRGIVCSCAMNKVHTVHEYTSVQDMENVARILLALATESI